MRKAARTLSFTIAIATLLGACQAVPTGTDGSFATQDRRDRPKQTAPKQPARPQRPARPQPPKGNPGGKRPQPPNGSPGGQRPKPDQPQRDRDRYRPQPTPYPGYPGDWNDADRWERQRRSNVRITRVWTEDVGSDHLTVHWTTDQPTVGMVQWGTDDFRDHTDWEPTADTYHAVVVDQLEADTEYRFRVMARVAGGAGVTSPELRVRTEP